MKSLLAATGIGLVFVYVIGSGLWVNTGDNWYRNLNQPPWQPPDFIFGIIWPYNFIILGVAPRDELRGHFTCVRLVGIEPTTSDIVRTALYPMSYNRTQCAN